MSERRYFNLGPVVRDLEHGSGPDATAEGRDLWARFCDIVSAAQETAASLDADDGSEDEAESDAWDEPDVEDGEQRAGSPAVRRPGGVASSIAEMRAELAGMASALATLKGPTRGVSAGPPALDGAVQRARKVGPRPKARKSRAKKATK